MTYAEPWPAPLAQHPVDAVVTLPGSKSVTNRALVLGALASGTTVVRHPLRSRDTELMVAGLGVLGVDISDERRDWIVTGAPGALVPRDLLVDVGNAGTVARFLPALAALATGPVTFDGDARMRDRPMGALLAALRELGVTLDAHDGALPLTVHGRGRVRGGSVTVDASTSSQLVSGLLLAGPRFDQGLDLRHAGPPMPSAPHVEMTVAMMRDFGATVRTDEPGRWVVDPGAYAARAVVVEPDLSGAAPFLAAAVATGGRVRMPGWPTDTTQPGALLLGLLERMGAQCTVDAEGLTVVGPDRLDGLDADLSDCGELTPTLAVLAALATTPSRLHGVAHLRGQETDRLAALARELSARGATVRELPDGLEIAPAQLHGGLMHTYADHRLAMAAALLGLAVPDVAVEDVATTAKTMPDFVERWLELVSTQ